MLDKLGSMPSSEDELVAGEFNDTEFSIVSVERRINCFFCQASEVRRCV
jgi:hypothetical protein